MQRQVGIQTFNSRVDLHNSYTTGVASFKECCLVFKFALQFQDARVHGVDLLVIGFDPGLEGSSVLALLELLALRRSWLPVLIVFLTLVDWLIELVLICGRLLIRLICFPAKSSNISSI